MRTPLLLAAALTLIAAGCDGDDTSTTSSSTGSPNREATTCPGAGADDRAGAPPGAVEADVDGNGVPDWAWVATEVEVGPPLLQVQLDSGLSAWTPLDEDSVLEPEIVSAVDVGDDRDTLLVIIGAGAYTQLVGLYGFAECELGPIVDPDEPELGPFVLAEGASVMNGQYYACVTTDGATALLTGGWSTSEAGEKEWSEGLVRRSGLEVTQVGEAVTGTASTEEEIGTDRGEACPVPVPVEAPA